MLRFFSIVCTFYAPPSISVYSSQVLQSYYSGSSNESSVSNALHVKDEALRPTESATMCKFEQTTWACGHQTHFRCSPCHHARTWPTCESVKTLYRVLENCHFECPGCQNAKKIPTDLFQQRNYSVEVPESPNQERWTAFWEAMRREYGSPQQIQNRQQWQQQLEPTTAVMSPPPASLFRGPLRHQD